MARNRKWLNDKTNEAIDHIEQHGPKTVSELADEKDWGWDSTYRALRAAREARRLDRRPRVNIGIGDHPDEYFVPERECEVCGESRDVTELKSMGGVREVCKGCRDEAKTDRLGLAGEGWA